jgi:iron complex transport system substrate-binding protein
MKFFAAFYNLDKVADEVFEEKIAKFEQIKAAASGLEPKPKVVSGQVYSGTFYTQSGDSLHAKMLAEAGGTYYAPELAGSGSVTLGAEEFVARGRDADYFIYYTMLQYMPSIKVLIETEPLFAEFKSVQEGNVYVYDKGYYMNSASFEEKFEDVVHILHPEYNPDHVLKHYIKLPAE